MCFGWGGADLGVVGVTGDLTPAFPGADMGFGGDLTAGDLTAGDLTAGDLTAGDLAAGDLTAGALPFSCPTTFDEECPFSRGLDNFFRESKVSLSESVITEIQQKPRQPGPIA